MAPEFGLRLSVAYLDHGARGEASRADAAFVEDLAGSLGLPFDLGRWRPTRAGHFEADARRARYDWLLATARARGASAVAVGHTLDDQAETILHRIVRGTGLRGLSGMPARRKLGVEPGVLLVRPLLSVRRTQIREALGSICQAYREDASNADLSRTRARIRHDLLPRLAGGYNPRVAGALVRLGALAGASGRMIESRLHELEVETVRFLDRDRVLLRRDRLSRLPRFLRAELLRRVWRNAGWPEAGMSAGRWRRLASLTDGRPITRASIGGGIELTTARGSGDPAGDSMLRRTISVPSPPAEDAAIEEVPIEVPGRIVWRGLTIETVLDPDAPRDETIDLDRVVLPLRVRAPLPGDRFEPLGMGGRGTPLKDFLRGRRVPPEDRARTPLLCDELGIVWVVGHRIADRVKVTDRTGRLLGLRSGQ
jgi:tRNA(Ile)-lysidine synthase